MKTFANCSAEEALNFIHLYLETADVLNAAVSKYRRLAEVSTTNTDRSKFRALALDTERDVELIKNQRRAFFDFNLAINPPSVEVVNTTKELATRLAKIIATSAKANAIIAIAVQAIDAFTKTVEQTA